MYIVITKPNIFKGEAEEITMMFQSGLECLHLRKPESAVDECRELLQAIPKAYHPRIVIHEHFELLQEFSLRGVHLNRRNPVAPEGWGGHVSVSCHSIEELKLRKEERWTVKGEDGSETEKQFDYLSLSPIYDSISKEGYRAAFSLEDIQKAKEEGVIDGCVMALGGICKDNVEAALNLGFGGVMVLGDAWTSPCAGRIALEHRLPIVLTIAGSDTSAGAGIQQDLKTITNCGCYGTTVITALTSQNTVGVQSVMPVPAEVVESQMRSVFSDMRVDAVKIGMIPNEDVARAIVKVLKEERRKRILPVVCDPIMLSTSGARLMSEECIRFVHKELFPLCTLVTPNIPEYEYLQAQGLTICSNILLKGGHADGEAMTDTLILQAENREETFSSPRIDTRNLHGTGCTMSSAIASLLAKRLPLCDAVSFAKQYMNKAIEGGKNLRLGRGNGPILPMPLPQMHRVRPHVSAAELEERVQRAVEYFMQGYGCCQSVVAAFADLYGFTDEQSKLIGAGFGGGVGRMRMMCGAVSGLVVLVGMSDGQIDGADREGKAHCYSVVQQLLDKSKKENGSIICAELLGIKGAVPMGNFVPDERNAEYYRKRPCAAKVESAARIFAEYLSIFC